LSRSYIPPVLLFFGGVDLAGCRRRGFSGCPCAEGALADTIITVPRIGPRALDDPHENRQVIADVRQRNIEFLKSSEKPQAVLLMVAPSEELLGQATPIQ